MRRIRVHYRRNPLGRTIKKIRKRVAGLTITPRTPVAETTFDLGLIQGLHIFGDFWIQLVPVGKDSARKHVTVYFNGEKVFDGKYTVGDIIRFRKRLRPGHIKGIIKVVMDKPQCRYDVNIGAEITYVKRRYTLPVEPRPPYIEEETKEKKKKKKKISIGI